jgi:hypothetical protein
MSILTAFRRLTSACAAFLGPHGAVTQLARQHHCSRQTIYREAHRTLAALEDADLRQRIAALEAALAQRDAQLQTPSDRPIALTKDQQAQFAATAQAIGVSLNQTHRLLAVLMGDRTPGKATLGRRARAAGRRAGPLLKVLDTFSQQRARQIAADEIFSGHQPILMTVEQHSLCWLGGRLHRQRDGTAWAAEFRALTSAEQVTVDGGSGLRTGLQQVNRERQQAGRPRILRQCDHFHALQRARRAICQARQQAVRALKRAERLQKEYDRQGRQGALRSGAQGLQRKHAWAKAEQAMDRWSTQEQAFERLRQGLRLITPEGALNTRARAEAEVRAALAGQTGADWTRARRLLGREAFTFLDRVHEQLAKLPLAPELVQTAVTVEGLRRRPELLRGESRSARAARGRLLIAGVMLAQAGPLGEEATTRVRTVLSQAWRASSLVETVNSVVRMNQGRQKRLSQELLDLQRLYWNVQVFRSGKRRRSSPYARLGVVLPEQGWWELLQQSPEALHRELCQRNPSVNLEKQAQELSAQYDAA